LFAIGALAAWVITLAGMLAQLRYFLKSARSHQ